MRTGATTPKNIPVPQIDLVSHPLIEDPDISPVQNYSPEVVINMFNQQFSVLLDSGASISAMSEDFYKTLLNIKPKPIILTLPVNGVSISTALKGKNKKVTLQAFVNFKIHDTETKAVFLIVPGLSSPIILGSDWLTENLVKIDYSIKEVSSPLWKDLHEVKPQTYVKNNSRVNDPHHESIIITGNEINHVEIVDDNSCLPSNNEDIKVDVLCNNEKHLLSYQQQSQLDSLIDDYHNIFNDRPGLHKFFTYKYNVHEHHPFKIKPYPVPFSRRPAIQQELTKMINWGIIERSDSAYNNPILSVQKTDGSIRLCLDARKLNTIIIPTRDASPPVDEILAKFHNKAFFTTLDFSSGYWQIPLDPTVRKYTSFLYEGRSYQFCVVPFGLNISNAAFGKGLEVALSSTTPDLISSILPEDIHIYVDDILIASETFEQHMNSLQWVFERISLAKLTLKFKKCHFMQKQIKFLGHLISPGGMTMDSDKIIAIQQFPEPRNKKDLQSFFGFCNFYRKFSKNHSSLLHPLSHLVKKGVTWKFAEGEKTAFNKIKSAFSNQILLTHPDFNIKFCIQTDASLIGIGAELFQIDQFGERNTIAFASRTLLPAEKNYSITELELLGIIFACQKFRIYILGYPVDVYTDHQALTFLFTCRLRNARLSRWTLILQEYNLTLHYCIGKDNPLDTLSRHPVGRDLQVEKNSPTILNITIPPLLSLEMQKIFSDISNKQAKDYRLADIQTNLKLQSEQLGGLSSSYQLYNNVLFFRNQKSLSSSWTICIPRQIIVKTVIVFHEYYGHPGADKTINLMRTCVSFPKFNQIIRKIVRACDICQRTKPVNFNPKGVMVPVQSTNPLDKIFVDIYGPLPTGKFRYTYLLVVLDNFTRFVKLYPLCKATSKACLKKILEEYIPMYGKPKVIVSDHGRQFVGKLWQQSLIKNNICVSMTSVYHPQSNPAERVMRELGRMFRLYCHEHHNSWTQHVNYVEWVLNNLKHHSTTYTPCELFLHTTIHNPISNIKFPRNNTDTYDNRITMAREIQKARAQQRVARQSRSNHLIKYNIGDLVLVRVHKLSNAIQRKIHKFYLLYEGPFEISQIKTINAYVVIHPESRLVRGTFNCIHLKKYIVPSEVL